ncbi:MAG: twin-arginine translocase subunit TatC [Anaerolineales bacterium]|nr:twin-arginine translocase subunit TatC [Chloroflexota bacterium]MBL6980510.1 twin-arginine translocase subunit TatC [Anaerolineales bacterium]
MTIEDQTDTRKGISQKRKAFWGHMEELRRRLLKAVVVLIIATGGSLVFVKRGLEFLLIPMGENRPVALHPTESIVVYFRIALLLGLVFAMPVIVFQILAFFVPALTRSERKVLLTSVFGVGFFFALGVAFAGGVMLPLAINYLQGFMDELVQPTYSIDGYISFVTTVMISSGVVFETPLLLALVARMGLVTSKQLAKGRRFALVAIAIIAAVITPTPDMFNMLLVMAPLLVLYEFGIVLAWFAGRARQKALADTGQVGI